MHSDQFLERFKVRISKINDRELIEKQYYEDLSTCLKYGHFESFRKLFNSSINFNIFIDVEKIPNRFDIISTLLLSCTDKVSTGYQTSALGEIIDILRFCNEFNLLERKLTETEEEALKAVKKDILFLANLKDLFGKISNSLIFYVYDVMPRDLYDYFINNPISYFPDRDGLMYYIKNIFFDQYTIYGLSVRYLSSIEQFLNVFEKNYLFYKQEKDNHKVNSSIKDHEFVEFDIVYKYRTYYYETDEEHENREIKKHLVSPENIMKNLNNILAKENYNFYNLSMVLLGGLGPQGLGFTYSTPKGEVIEICSDINQNKAVIIKFKEFLKKQFIEKLGKELENSPIKKNTIKRIVDFLVENLSKEEIIDYSKKKSIIFHIKNFLIKDGYHRDFYKSAFHKLIDQISNAISIILRPIKMIDQYKARMNLIADGKLKSKDISKLTSLKEKSHYDVLRERFFFQYIIDWFYEIYCEEKAKIKS